MNQKLAQNQGLILLIAATIGFVGSLSFLNLTRPTVEVTTRQLDSTSVKTIPIDVEYNGKTVSCEAIVSSDSEAFFITTDVMKELGIQSADKISAVDGRPAAIVFKDFVVRAGKDSVMSTAVIDTSNSETSKYCALSRSFAQQVL